MMKKKILNKQNIYIFFVFLFCFAVTVISECLYIEQQWIGDAGDYWAQGVTLGDAGFDLTAITGFRGYVFPVFLGIINYLGGKGLWYIVNGIFLSFFAVVVIPKIVRDSQKISWAYAIQTGICWVLMDILFIGLVIYPLSDMFALVLMCVAVLCAKISLTESRKFLKIVATFFSGLFSYLAYNVRTIYLFAAIALLIIYIYIYIYN